MPAKRCLVCILCLLTVSAYGKELPFTVLDRVQEREAVASARRAVELWLKKDYDSLYRLLSGAENFFSEIPEPRRKSSFVKWCQGWRERNAYNSRLTPNEKIERVRRVTVDERFITAFVMKYMREEYFKALVNATWDRNKKLAFIEFYIRGKRYIQPLLLEGRDWKILSIPLTWDEAMIEELTRKSRSK
ncbi:MAG: hypothetical protein WHX60_09415 [Armatimonadota bacterium]